MRILIVLLLTFLCSVVLTQDANAYEFSYFDNLEKKIWTKEEMLNAKPIDLPMLPADEIEKLHGINVTKALEDLKEGILNTRECEQQSTFPYSATGKLFMAGGGSCSASYVGSGIVLTAGHCVSNGRGQYRTSFTFCPMHKDGSCPRGQFTGTRAVTHAQWHNGGSFARDTAFIKITGNPGQNLNLWINHNRASQVTAVGWPGNVGGGRRMICSTNPMQAGNRAHNPLSVQLRSTMTFGSSGGAWIGSSGVASVVSHGTPGTGIMFGPYFDDATQQMMRSI